MKSIRNFFIAIVLMAVSSKFSFAAHYTIEADSSEFIQSFDSVVVGDTIKWIWLEGNHTTTSNGIPSGAQPWNEMLDDHNTSFTYVVIVGGTYDYISVPDAPLMGGTFVATWPTGISNAEAVVSNFNIIGNPVRDNIQFQFSITESSSSFTTTGSGVDISLYNIYGMKLQTLYHNNIPAAELTEEVALKPGIHDGIYFVVLRVDEAMITRQIVIQ